MPTPSLSSPAPIIDKNDLSLKLLAASEKQDLELMRDCLDKGADVNMLPSPISIALRYDNAPMLELLVNYGVKLDIPDNFGFILKAAKHASLKTLDIFLSKLTSLSEEIFFLQACTEDNVDMVNLLLSKGEKPGSRLDKIIILTLSSSSTNIKPGFPALALLLEKEGAPNIREPGLEALIEENSLSLLNLLIEKTKIDSDFNATALYTNIFRLSLKLGNNQVLKYFAPQSPKELLVAVAEFNEIKHVFQSDSYGARHEAIIIQRKAWLASFCLPFKEQQELDSSIVSSNNQFTSSKRI